MLRILNQPKESKMRLFSIVSSVLTVAVFSTALQADDMPKLRVIESNGIRMRIAEMGEGPLVLLLHGWPESWYSWRHQLPFLASAGYRVVAPDMRGFGGSDAPERVEEYDILKLTGDVVGILDALEEDTAVVVGHDWGANVAWDCALLHPERFRAVITLANPYHGREWGWRPPMASLKRTIFEKSRRVSSVVMSKLSGLDHGRD